MFSALFVEVTASNLCKGIGYYDGIYFILLTASKQILVCPFRKSFTWGNIIKSKNAACTVEKKNAYQIFGKKIWKENIYLGKVNAYMLGCYWNES
jgi:hypothetical protein